jgi:hypothetical protein
MMVDKLRRFHWFAEAEVEVEVDHYRKWFAEVEEEEGVEVG